MPPARLQENSQPGFSLVEILIVMAVLAVVAALAIPYFTASDGSICQAAARQIQADLDYARTEAQRRQSGITITFDISAESYTLSGVSGTIVRPDGSGQYVVNLPQTVGSSVNILSVDFGSGSKSMTYDSRGDPLVGDGSGNQPVSSSNSVIVQYGSAKFKLHVEPIMARITIEPAS